MGAVDDLRACRRSLNLAVVQAVKEVSFSEDIALQVEKDSLIGAMMLPRPVQAGDPVSLARRIPVRELKPNGWRTRVVDHETESGVNVCAWPQDRISHDTLDALADMVLL